MYRSSACILFASEQLTHMSQLRLYTVNHRGVSC